MRWRRRSEVDQTRKPSTFPNCALIYFLSSLACLVGFGAQADDPEVICGRKGSQPIAHFSFILRANTFVENGGDVDAAIDCLECIARTSENSEKRFAAMNAMYQLGGGNERTTRRLLALVIDPNVKSDVAHRAAKFLSFHMNAEIERELISVLNQSPAELTSETIHWLLFEVGSAAYGEWLQEKGIEKREQDLIRMAQEPALILHGLSAGLSDWEASWMLRQGARRGVSRELLRSVLVKRLEQTNGSFDGIYALMRTGIRLELFQENDYARFAKLDRAANVQMPDEQLHLDWISLPEAREREVMGIEARE